mmetsp:Transcript_33602/g.84380  ORF Transcript_33602/g.84380 Transcript_33602/m.84380 type:complete len:298 (-) Transcript_33602:370-1263(-)
MPTQTACMSLAGRCQRRAPSLSPCRSCSCAATPTLFWTSLPPSAWTLPWRRRRIILRPSARKARPPPTRRATSVSAALPACCPVMPAAAGTPSPSGNAGRACALAADTPCSRLVSSARPTATTISLPRKTWLRAYSRAASCCWATRPCRRRTPSWSSCWACRRCRCHRPSRPACQTALPAGWRLPCLRRLLATRCPCRACRASSCRHLHTRPRPPHRARSPSISSVRPRWRGTRWASCRCWWATCTTTCTPTCCPYPTWWCSRRGCTTLPTRSTPFHGSVSISWRRFRSSARSTTAR